MTLLLQLTPFSFRLEDSFFQFGRTRRFSSAVFFAQSPFSGTVFRPLPFDRGDQSLSRDSTIRRLRTRILDRYAHTTGPMA